MIEMMLSTMINGKSLKYFWKPSSTHIFDFNLVCLFSIILYLRIQQNYLDHRQKVRKLHSFVRKLFFISTRDILKLRPREFSLERFKAILYIARSMT